MKGHQIFTILLLQVITYAASQEARGDHLLRTLFGRDYHSGNIPMKNANDTVKVNLDLNLVRVVDFDDDTNIITIIGWPVMSWNDFRLTWDPDLADKITDIRAAIYILWNPDIRLYNSVDPVLEYPPVNTVIGSDGTVYWIPPMRYSFPCEAEGKGVYNCTAKFGSWTYHGFLLDLSTEQLDITYLSPNPKFSVSEPKVKKNVVYYPCCKEPYPNVDFNFKLTVK